MRALRHRLGHWLLRDALPLAVTCNEVDGAALLAEYRRTHAGQLGSVRVHGSEGQALLAKLREANPRR